MPEPQNGQNGNSVAAAKRRDEVLLRMLKTPPKPHEDMKGKGKPPKVDETEK